MEVQLLDRETLSLVPASTRLMEQVHAGNGWLKHELMLSNIEVNTKVCGIVAEAEADLFDKFLKLFRVAEDAGVVLGLAGSHPFSRWRDQQVTDDARYQRLVDLLGIIARRFNIFGLHVHVGVDSGEKCIYILNRMLYYLPCLLALSANSPFWEGEDTNLRSHRVKVFESLPHAGLPFYLSGWSDYSRIVRNYIKTGAIETIREIWWDVRPHNDFGTLEVRICDTPSTLREALAIAALIQALAAKLGREFDRGGRAVKKPHSSIIRENKWRACRFGLEGRIICEKGTKTIAVKESVRKLVVSLKKEATALESVSYLDAVEEMLERGDGASRQLAVWRETGDLKAVVRGQVAALKSELSSGGFAKVQ